MFSSNGVSIDDSHFGSLKDSTHLLHDSEALREAYARDGYLKISWLLEEQSVLDARELYFSLMPPSLLRGSPREGVFSGVHPELPAHGTPGHPAHTFVRTPQFDSFARNRSLAAVAKVLLGGPVKQLRRRPVRHFTPGPRASRAHIDLTYLDQGTDQIVTAWVPIGPCPRASGALAYLENSRNLDIDKIRDAMPTDRVKDRRPITHDLQALAQHTKRRWLIADFKVGDVVFHDPRIIHASLDASTDLMRLSTDLRFVRRNEETDPRWNNDWVGDDGY